MRSISVFAGLPLIAVAAVGFAQTPSGIGPSQGSLSQPIADSVAEFSCTQGQDNWRYGYYDGPFAPVPPPTDFQEMSQCIDDPYRPGDAWWVNPALYWTSIASEISFPNGPTSCGRQHVEHWAVRRWVSEVHGSIEVAGILEGANSGSFTGRILVDGSVAWQQSVSSRQSVPYSIHVAVNTGSLIDFAVAPDGSDCGDWARFTAVISIDTPGANLQVSALKGKAVAGAGRPYAAKDTTKNIGVADALASETWFYLSTDPTKDPDDIHLMPLEGRSVPPLPVGAASTGTTMVTIPAGTPIAKRFLIACADGGDHIVETNEGDNCRSKAIYVGPDLAVKTLTAPVSASRGQMISVTDTTRNAGGAPASVDTTTAFYLSLDKKLKPGEDILLGGRTVNPLAAGASNTATTTVTIPPQIPTGAYYLLAKADDGGVQDESRETNNVKARAITVN